MPFSQWVAFVVTRLMILLNLMNNLFYLKLRVILEVDNGTIKNLNNSVKLDLNQFIGNDKSYAFFPGQIVGIEGTNFNGKQLQVSAIHLPPPPSSGATPVSELMSFYPLDDPNAKRPINVVIGCGPFTLDDSLEYEPFEELVTSIENQPPDIVILMGPFVDEDHPMIVAGDVYCDVDQLFRDQISAVDFAIHSLAP